MPGVPGMEGLNGQKVRCCHGNKVFNIRASESDRWLQPHSLRTSLINMFLLEGGGRFAWTKGPQRIRRTTCKLTGFSASPSVNTESEGSPKWFSPSPSGWDGFAWYTWSERTNWTEGNRFFYISDLKLKVSSKWNQLLSYQRTLIGGCMQACFAALAESVTPKWESCR